MTPLGPRGLLSMKVNRQRGAVLILFFMALFLSSATVVLAALNNRNPQLRRALEMQRELHEVKDLLLGYAAMFPENYSGQPAGYGPGRLPCPDTDNDGVENCSGVGLGRLPRTVQYNPSGTMELSSLGVSQDQQFWYAVHPNFWRSATSIVNSSTPTTFTLDGGAAEVVALLIISGETLTGQVRPSFTTASNYLEGGNADVPTFFSANNAAPADFNDQVLAITLGDVMTMATARVAQQIKLRLDAYHPGNGNSYPVQASLGAALTGVPAWFTDDAWAGQIETYTLLNTNSFSVKFTNCDIVYTSIYDSDGLTRNQNSC